MNQVISREYVAKNYIHKDKLKKIKQSIDVLRNADGCPIIKLDLAMNNIVSFYDELMEETEDENNNTFTMQKQEEQPTDSNKQQNT